MNNQTHSKCDIVSTNCVKNCCQHIFLFHTFKITKIGLFFNITQNYVPWIKKSKHKIVSYPALCCSTVCIVVCLHVQIKDHFKNDISTLYIHFFHRCVPDTTLKLYSTEVGPSSDFQGERSGFFSIKAKKTGFFSIKTKKDPFFL